MAHRQPTARHTSRDRGSRVPSKIVDKNTGKTYRTGKMLGKVRAAATADAISAIRVAAAPDARPLSEWIATARNFDPLLRTPKRSQTAYTVYPRHIVLACG